MFLLQPCPTITDNVQLQPVGQFASLTAKMNQTRTLIKLFSNTQKLIERVQGGQVIMSYKIRFDEYLKAQVDLMKTYVGTSTNCQFAYNGFFGAKSINTATMGIKQQWGFEIIMSRLILSSGYIGGAIQSIGKLFQQTVNSYDVGYTNTGAFTNHLQIMWKYFTESIDPLKRLYPVSEYVSKLFSPYVVSTYPEANPQMFKFFTEVIMSNLAYLKLQKLRLLKQYKSCKQGAWSVYQKFKQLKLKLTRFSQQYQLPDSIRNFINLGIVFYKAYSLNFLLLENQSKKTEQQYGFIKKQFQVMILENLVISDQILKLQSIAKKLPGQQQDNVIFANMVLGVIAKHAQSIKYKFEFDIHETKLQLPSIQQISAQIQYKNIWNQLGQF